MPLHGIGECLTNEHRAPSQLDVGGELRHSQQQFDGEGSAGRDRVVGDLARTGDQRLVIACRIEEGVHGVVPEPRHRRVREVHRAPHPRGIERQLVHT